MKINTQISEISPVPPLAFGQSPKCEESWKQSLIKTTTIFAKIAATGSLGFVLGGAAVGVSISGGMLCLFLAHKIALFALRYKYTLTIPEDDPNLINRNLGQMKKADLRIEDHVTAAYEWKKNLVNAAMQSIEISPNYAGGKPFRDFLDVVEWRMDQVPTLKVHLLVSNDLLEKEDKNKLELLKKNYPHFNYLISDWIVRFNSGLCSEENHTKMCIVDGKYFTLGGSGICPNQIRENFLPDEEERRNETASSKTVDKSFYDINVVGCGEEIAEEMRQQFFRLYRIWEMRRYNIASKSRYFPLSSTKAHVSFFHQKGESLIENVSLKLVIGGPEHGLQNGLNCEIIRSIESAKKKITFALPMFNPVEPIKKALKNTQVAKILYSNGITKGCQTRKLLVWPSRLNYDFFSKVFELQKDNQLFHPKVMIVDDEISMIGTYNMNIKSGKRDHEMAFFMKDERVAKKLCKSLNEERHSFKELNQRELSLQKRSHWLKGRVIINLLANFVG